MAEKFRLIPPRNRARISADGFSATQIPSSSALVSISGVWAIQEGGSAITVVDLTKYKGRQVKVSYNQPLPSFVRYGVGITKGDSLPPLYAVVAQYGNHTYTIDLTQYPTATKLWLPPFANVNVVIDGIDITYDIMNWPELDITFSRDGLSGVFTAVQEALQVCRTGKDIIRNAFRQSMLTANLMFEVERRSPHPNPVTLTYDWETIHAMRLNMGSYAEYRDHVEIDGTAQTFNSLVKSVGKTKYDIPVADLTTRDWRYLHNEMITKGNYTLPEVFIKPESTRLNHIIYFPTINLDKAEMVINGIGNDFKTQEYLLKQGGSNDSVVPDDKYFFRAAFLSDDNAVESQTIRFIADFDYQANGSVTVPTGETVIYDFVIESYNDTSSNEIKRIPLTIKGTAISKTPPIGNPDYLGSIDEKINITINKGDKLRFYVEYAGYPGAFSVNFRILKNRAFIVSYEDKPIQTDTIPVVTSETMGNYLLYRMADGDASKAYTVSIDTDTALPAGVNHYLVAAESIRGYEPKQNADGEETSKGACFHANFNDYLEYMQFLGYEYDVDEIVKVVRFKKRGTFFDPTTTAIDLTKDEVANLQIRANDEYAYSTVRVGYEKPDIENTNGRFAICGAFDYKTEYENTSKSDSTLEIMCPYKADPVEIEVLSWTRAEKTTDQKADNDIFMLAGTVVGTGETAYVQEDRSTQYMVADADLGTSIGFYNVPYIPYYIALRNTNKIGIVAKQLKFTGTDAFRDATLAGAITTDPYSDISVTDALFLPVDFEFDVGTHQELPPLNKRSGLVTFVWKGQLYKGYIHELIKNLHHDEQNTWVLRAYNLP